MGMGLTERHWFENEEPELTDRQLEDIVYENKKAYDNGYVKGFHDAKQQMKCSINLEANMKWIYAELRNVNNRPLSSYKINPAYIMAVDLNEQKLIIKDFAHPLYYNKEDENLILQLINDEVGK